MKRRSLKTSQRQSKKAQVKRVNSNAVSSALTEESNAVPDDGGNVSQSFARSSPNTPKRSRRQTGRAEEICRTSTPVRSSSTDSCPQAKQTELEYTEVISQLKASESPCCKSASQRKFKRVTASQPRLLRKRTQKELLHSKTSSPQAKRRRCETQKLERTSQTKIRPRFEPKKPDAAEQDESLLSSDLSIELSHHEEKLPLFSLQEEEESEEQEEELPSFLMQMDKKHQSITEGAFVWHKVRNYPFWPALVKSVNRKQKKASIVFIDEPLIHEKKGFSVPLRSLKPFDCEEADELVSKAKEEYDAAIEWSTELIADYRIRIACASFSGSFIEYIAHDMSYPVRRKYPHAASERLTITSDSMMEEPFDNLEDSFSEQTREVSKSLKRLLPDRTQAAHNRANEKLVHFIVQQRMVDERLLGVIRGQQHSRWLRSFQRTAQRQVVDTYLEDEKQLDKVYSYLHDLFMRERATAPCLTEVKSMEHIPFVLDVLLPEAIIHAIAGVESVSVNKAEEKYLEGRCISNREIQQFDLRIERQMRKKSRHQTIACGFGFSDPLTERTVVV